MRRVVVTGIGMVSPVGANVDDSWANLLAGKSGATRVTRMDVSNMACQVGCEVKTGDGTNGTFNCDDWMEPKEQRRYDTFIKYGLAAAKMAVRDSGWEPKTDEEGWRTGVMIGSGVGGLPLIEATSNLLAEKGPRRVSPFFIPGSLINLVSGLVSIEFGFKGQPRRCYSMFVRITCHWGCCPDRGARRCRRNDRRRRRGGHLPYRLCRFSGLQGAFNSFQRYAREGIASL